MRERKRISTWNFYLSHPLTRLISSHRWPVGGLHSFWKWSLIFWWNDKFAVFFSFSNGATCFAFIILAGRSCSYMWIRMVTCRSVSVYVWITRNYLFFWDIHYFSVLFLFLQWILKSPIWSHWYVLIYCNINKHSSLFCHFVTTCNRKVTSKTILVLRNYIFKYNLLLIPG